MQQGVVFPYLKRTPPPVLFSGAKRRKNSNKVQFKKCMDIFGWSEKVVDIRGGGWKGLLVIIRGLEGLPAPVGVVSDKMKREVMLYSRRYKWRRKRGGS